MSYKFEEPLTGDDVIALIHLLKKNQDIYDRLHNQLKKCNKCGKVGHTNSLYSENGFVDFEKNRKQCKDCRRVYKHEFYETKTKIKQKAN